MQALPRPHIKNEDNLELGRVPQVSEIKLIRTDTTLDHSQNGNEAMLSTAGSAVIRDDGDMQLMGCNVSQR
jgi:hypothetical protein